MAASLIGKVSDRVSFTVKIPTLLKATSDDESPTQEIMYQEVNDITFESVSSCTHLLDFLLERLKKKSPLVKYKVLKVLQYLVTNGHPEFRSALRHNAGPIRETQSFHGTLNSLHGDSLNQRAREKASELIEILFDVDSDKPRSTVMTGPSKKMEGFGNTTFQPTKNESWKDTVKNLTEQYVTEFSKLMKPNEDHNRERRLVDRHFHSECVGSVNLTGEEEENFGIPSTYSVDARSFTEEQIPRWKSENYMSSKTDQAKAEQSLAPEVQLVNELTAEGGIRSVPSREMLTKFSSRCANLNVDKALELLNEKLQEPVTEVQLKSLCVIDHLLKCDIPRIASKVSLCCPNLEALISSGQEPGSLKAKASKILTIVKVQRQGEEGDTGDLNRVQEKQDNGAPAPLLDVLEVRSLALDENSALFTGMNVHATASVPTPTSPRRAMETAKDSSTSDEVSRMFQGFDISSSSHINEAQQGFADNPSSVQNQHLLETQSTMEALQAKDTAKQDTLEDIFDPLCQTSSSSSANFTVKPAYNGSRNLLDFSGSSSDTSQVEASSRKDQRSGDLPVSSAVSLQSFFHQSPSGYSGLTSFPANNLASSSRLTGFTPSAGVQSSVFSTVQGPRSPYVGLQSSSLSSASTVPLRLPRPSSQKSDFGFVGKSGKADAFSFVQDEMRARKK